MWCVETRSVTLYNLLKPLKIRNIKKFVEANAETISAFPRGFFDVEGCCETGGTRRVRCSNKNLKLMRYVQRLLRSLKIDCTLRKRAKKTPSGRRTSIWVIGFQFKDAKEAETISTMLKILRNKP